ncbi:MAG: hypothetical protein HFJ93_07065 [Muribaculaceae bacterium]|nr:hypothetical protein [Muribaculaceae bacterium]
MTIRSIKLLIAAAAAVTSVVAAAFDREGLIVPYAEDHFPDMASMRYDRSPYYRAIERAADSATIRIPADWAGKRIVVGVGYPSDTAGVPGLTINGHNPGTGVRPLRWDVTHLLPKHGDRSVTLRGLGSKERRVYAYATPSEVWVDRYHITSALDSADLSTGMFEVDIDLGGVRRPTPAIAVEYMLFDASRHQVAAGRADAAPHLRFKARIPDIHRWSTDDPYRYMLAIILRDDRTGRHIMTVGSPMRFANYTARAGEGPVLNAVPMGPLSLAALDSIPVTADSREALAAALRAAGANAVIGFDRMAERYSRVVTELTDTATLTLAATTRSPFAPLSDFALDYELISPLGVTLTSGQGVVTPGGARERTLIPLLPPLPSGAQASLLPDDMTEAYLNIAWRPLRPMAGAEPGQPTAKRQFVVGHAPRLVPANPQKMKRKRDTWRAQGVELTLARSSGLPTSIMLESKEMLPSPVGATIDGISVRCVASSVEYDKHNRSLTAILRLENPTTGIDLGSATLIYSAGNDHTLDIAMRDATPGFALTFPAPADRIYLGRGPGDSPASDHSPSRIALYQAKAPGSNISESHADTRRVALLPQGLSITLDHPAELTLTRNRAAISASASTIRLSALR